MLLLKANSELQKVFGKLIKTMKVPVAWNDILVISNNSLILAGDVRSLIFNFDNKKSYTSIIEIPEESIRLQSMPADHILSNVMNMALYTFGKWGVITGLKVDKDYAALNALFADALRPVGIEPGFTKDNFRFFRGGIQITYEDTILAILWLLKQEGKLKEGQSLVTSELPQKVGEDSKADDSGKNNASSERPDLQDLEDDYYKLGLWHNMRWKNESADFRKTAHTEADAAKSRIGNNFYLTNYLCPKCGEKLYMGVYPTNKELLIDTEEGRVFMARAYACNACNTFYTPCPKKLLQEGDVYSLKFDEDRTAFEDYLDVLGHTAERTTNSNFNEFESDRNRPRSKTDDKTTKGLDPHTASGTPYLSEAKSLKEHLASRVKSGLKNRNPKDSEAEPAQSSKNESKNTSETEPTETGIRKTDSPNAVVSAPQKPGTAKNMPPVEKAASTKPDSSAEKAAPVKQTPPAEEMSSVKPAQPEPEPVPAAFRLAGKTTDELRSILSSLDRQQANTAPEQAEHENHYRKFVENALAEKLTAKYDARVRTLNNLNARQLSDLKTQIGKESVLSEDKKERYIREINSRLFQEEEKALLQKIELSKNRSYADIERMIEDIEKRSLPDDLKKEAVQKLRDIQAERAKQEVDHLINHMPLHMDRKQLATYLDKIDQYQGVDITPYRQQLEQRKNLAEKEEITAMIKRGGKKERNALWNLYEQLQKADYKEENKAPFLEKIYAKIQKMDEERIEQICPSIVNLSFAEGLKAHDRISQGMFLPELKVNTLEMIERRLTRLKTDESVQLMQKLKRDLEEELPDCTDFYYYNAREEMKRTSDTHTNTSVQADLYGEEERLEAENNRDAMLCSINGYAAQRGPYEYPLMVCDASRSKNGKEGFVLTPDHIFYHTLFSTGVINIPDIEKIQPGRKLFGKGIYVKCDGQKEKLPNHIPAQDWDAFAAVLDDFVIYLQERPESRSIEYMAKETHDVKCCYRCGFVYKTGNVCPKCGSKMNR
ncbi:MAG: hypothetical protein K2H40_00455 [Lachnospiraceae bacterium]|nr:hypothetical protein [Lachnospiraceae bacterium]